MSAKSAEPSRGLIVSHLDTIAPGLNVYAVKLWAAGAIANSRVEIATAPHAAALRVLPSIEGGVSWVVGVTRTMARAMRLRYRKRAPGGGRKRTSTLKAVTVWMTPAGKDGLDAKHAAADRAAGKVRGLGRFIEEDFVGLYAD